MKITILPTGAEDNADYCYAEVIRTPKDLNTRFYMAKIVYLAWDHCPFSIGESVLIPSGRIDRAEAADVLLIEELKDYITELKKIEE